MIETLSGALKVMVESNLLIHEITHSILVLPFVLIIWKKTKKIKFAVATFLVTYLLDLDHLLDYWAYYGLNFNLIDFFKMEYFSGKGSAFLPLHGWEWLTVLAYFSYKKGWKSYFTALTLGIFPHLVWDAVSVGSFLFYFFSYRAIIGFRIF